MRRTARVAMALLGVASVAWGNGGPFVVKYPKGDPAAKGVLATLDPSLKPTRETRLRVLKEDLKIAFANDGGLAVPAIKGAKSPERLPIVEVSAIYTIENPTGEAIEVDFGFPILRGIYVSPWGMSMRPAVRVLVGKKQVSPFIISNSAIYGLIRQRARQAIDRGIAADEHLARLVAGVRASQGTQRERARNALALYLVSSSKWTARDAALLVEYASIDLGTRRSYPLDASRTWYWGTRGPDAQAVKKLTTENLGPLSAIGEQKGTQCLAQLASRFDPEAAAAYEAIFTAWGGDVRERSVDLATGKVRPREFAVDKAFVTGTHKHVFRAVDPTVYARVDYLDEDAKLTAQEKASCRTVLKNLPVVFTFAPMNLLHYRAAFPARATQTLTVWYRQYAYIDSRPPRSYQLAYVVHPASLWRHFGPIRLEVLVPKGVTVRASTPSWSAGPGSRLPIPATHNGVRYGAYRTDVTARTGELLVAVDAESWQKALLDAKSQKVGALLPQGGREVRR